MTTLPIREMVLYKHGVGFFVRMGAVTGTQAALTFRADEVNDVLKSLTVIDQSGGQVLGIHYPTPMNRSERLTTSTINPGENRTLRDLLTQLRGRRAAILIEETPGTLENIEGRVVGVDFQYRSTHMGNFEENNFVAVLTDNGDVRAFKLNHIQSVTLLDDTSKSDLDFFLDTIAGDNLQRVVDIQLTDGDHTLVVHYTAPSPTWRVSYRLVGEAVDEEGLRGVAILQGWGLFDNRFDEDLDEVKLTLVAGQPISFIYDLYASEIPKRPTVKDQARVAPMPIEYEAAMDDLADDNLDSALADMDSSSRFAASESIVDQRLGLIAPKAAAASAPRFLRQAIVESAPKQAAVMSESGEFFQYEVATLVSVKRGESALVPLFNAELEYERELLYNGAKLPTHPVAALRFKNATGLTLERGPVTVVEDGDYRGEAIVPFTKNDNDVYLPYAVELGIKVTEKPDRRQITTGLSIRDGLVHYQTFMEYETVYVIENTLPKSVTVLIERAINSHTALYNTPAPDVETAADRRWRVPIKAKSRKEFTVIERMATTNTQLVRQLSYAQLADFLRQQWLDDALYHKLKVILDAVAEISRLQHDHGELEQERTTIFTRQEQIRANLAALQPTGDEAPLRKRVLSQLESTEDRLSAIDTELERIKAAIREQEAALKALVDALSH